MFIISPNPRDGEGAGRGFSPRIVISNVINEPQQISPKIFHNTLFLSSWKGGGLVKKATSHEFFKNVAWWIGPEYLLPRIVIGDIPTKSGS